jgi:hypothetical protein
MEEFAHSLNYCGGTVSMVWCYSRTGTYERSSPQDCPEGKWPFFHMRGDTIKHRILVCREWRSIWKWTRTRLASILWTNEAQIPDEWPMRPAFHLWPPKRHQAVLWILAQFVLFLTQYDTTANLLEYYHFMRRKRWKVYQQSKRQDKLGNYLSVL